MSKQTLAGMSNDELRDSISEVVKRHVPNINIPMQYHVIVEAFPLVYGEGMVKGYEFAEEKFSREIEELKMQYNEDYRKQHEQHEQFEMKTAMMQKQLHVLTEHLGKVDSIAQTVIIVNNL